MKKLLLSVLILILIAFMGYYGMSYFRSKKMTMTTDPVAVKTMTVTENSMPVDIKSIGTLVAKSIEITPEISGQVRAILFKDGQSVDVDAPLIQLDDAVFAAKFQSAKAQFEFSDADYNRKTYLAKQGAISQQAIDQAKAELKEKKASTDEAQVMLTKMRLKAPFAGVVSKSNVDVGDYVTGGQAVVTLTDTRHLRVEYDVPEQYLAQISLGQVVTVTTSTYPDQSYSARVAYISPTINVQNRSISIYANLDNKENKLKPGMFVTISHALPHSKNAILIPARSLVPVLDGEQVYKVVNNKAVPVTVTVGKHIGEDVQVTGGLVKGDVIVTDGQLKLRNAVDVIIKS